MTVGKKNSPPKEHQFKPGQSGNPKGRPKGAKNKKPRLRLVSPYDEKITFFIDGKPRRLKRREAAIHVARSMAIKDKDEKVQKELLDLDEKLGALERVVDYDMWVYTPHVVLSGGVKSVEDAVRLGGMGRLMRPFS